MNKWITKILLFGVFFLLAISKAFGLMDGFALSGSHEEFYYNDYANLVWGNPGGLCGPIKGDQFCFYLFTKESPEEPSLPLKIPQLQKINVPNDPTNPLTLIQTKSKDQWLIYNLKEKRTIIETDDFEEALKEWKNFGLSLPEFATHRNLGNYFEGLKESKREKKGDALFMRTAVFFTVIYFPYILGGIGLILLFILGYYLRAKIDKKKAIFLVFLSTLIAGLLFYQYTEKKVLDGYSRDARQAYENGILPPGADPQTFTALSEPYSKDKDNVYKGGLVMDRDAATFELLNSAYSKDKNAVYWDDEIEEGFDPQTFSVWDGDLFFLAKDKNGIYSYNNKIKGADLTTFEPIFRPYYRDQNHIYIENLDQIVRLKGAHRESFEVLPSMYAKDKDSIYYWGEVVKGTDVNTFQIAEGIAKDKDNVFFHEKKIFGVDPETFFILKDDYGGDKNSVYKGDQRIEGADPGTFIVLNDYYERDKNFGYFEGNIIQDSDGETFIVFAEIEGETVFFEYEDEDGQMVTAITSRQVFAKDKNHVYHLGEIVEEINPENFAP